LVSDRINLGVIGCGFFAQNHLRSWHDLAAEGVTIAAVCDVDPEKAQAAAKKFNVPRWYTDAAFAEEELGLVDIVTRMDTHRALVGAIVQKPFE
jgi:predicted dehydrogenase